MTNALALLQRNEIQLSDLDRMIMEEAAQDDTAFDPIPTRIKISPGGINVFSTTDNDTIKTFNAIAVISQKARAYWPDKGTGQPPFCASPDGSHGIVAPEITDAHYRAAITAREPHPAIKLLDADRGIPPHFDCGICPLAQWGSVHQGGAKGKSQACKTLRRLVVLVEGWAQPALLTLPPTSIVVWDTYCSSLARQKSSYFAVWTTFALESKKSANGDPYSVIALSTKSKITDTDQVRAVFAIRAEYKSLVAAMPIDGNEYDVVDANGDATVDATTGEVLDDRTPPF